MENALDEKATQIEVRFYRKGLNGFDIIYNGIGISDNELPDICKCFELRKRNELYKTKSIGYRGEALSSLAKSSTLTVITKHFKSDYAWKVRFNFRGEIANIEEYPDKKEPGTIIQVRDMHKNNENHRKRFFASLSTQYESCVALLNSYSYIFYDKTLVLS